MRKLMLLGLVMMFLLSVGTLAQASGNQLSVGDAKTFKFCSKNDVFVNHKAEFTLNDKVGNSYTYQYMGADAPADENTQIKLKDLESGETITLDYLYQAYAGGVKGAKLTVGLQQDYAGGIKEGKNYWLMLEGSPSSNEMDARLIIYLDDMATLPASGEEPVCSSYNIKVNQMGYDDAADKHFVKLEVNGELTSKLNKGGSFTLADGAVLSISDILYQAYAGGEQRVWFLINGEQGTEVVSVVSENLETSPVSKAVDLSSYPELFVKNGKLNVYFVVGGKAPSMDNLAMTDIAVGFDKAGYEVVNVAKLDSEVSNPLNTNLIVIGKPNENTVANLLFGGASNSLNQGEGMIKLFEHNGYVQMLVTGYSAEDTRKAAKVLQSYKDYDLVGKEVIVTGTMSNPQVQESAQPIVEPEVLPVQEEPQPQPEPTPQVEVPKEATCGECKVNGNCLPYGTRLVKDGKQVYCNIDGTLQEQQILGNVCQNSYECSSNQCSNAKCIDLSGQIEEAKGILEKILDWLKSIFG